MARFQHWRSLIREPVVQFLLIGSTLFVLHAALRPSQQPIAAEIVITDDQASGMVSQFARTWQRAPSRQELQALIDDEVRTEVYVREAMKLGLDQNDTIIRRRLRQKMEFLNESQFPSKSPDESELEAYFAANSRQYRTDAEVSFRHVFFDPQQRGDSLTDDAQAALLQLNNQGLGQISQALGIPLISLMTGQTSRERILSPCSAPPSRRLCSISPWADGPVRSTLLTAAIWFGWSLFQRGRFPSSMTSAQRSAATGFRISFAVIRMMPMDAC